jgi:hypothetical protein
MTSPLGGRLLGALALALLTVLGLSAPATAAPQQSTTAGVSSLTVYAKRTADYGVQNTPYRVLASVSGSAGQGTLSINRTVTVTGSATFTGGLDFKTIKAQIGVTGSYSVALQVGCSYQTGGRAATLTAYPRSRVVAYSVYQRVLGTNNDRFIGSGQYYQPVGVHCQLTYR